MRHTSTQVIKVHELYPVQPLRPALIVKMHSTIHLSVQYNTHLTVHTVRTRFILKLPTVLRMRVPACASVKL